jgi:hypothetical protein
MCTLKVFENMVPTNTLQSRKGELMKLQGDLFRIQYHQLNVINGLKLKIKV